MPILRGRELSRISLLLRANYVISGLLVAMTVVVALDEWGVLPIDWLKPAATVCVLGLLALRVRASRKAFVAAGVILTILLVVRMPEWQEVVLRGLGSAAFIGGFFTALSTLRNVAESSPSIRASGSFLAAQPPGRRYAALTLGGHLFALLLNYGSIALLGSLASASARAEQDAFIRTHRTRRMLLAIQRGFVSSLPWSPLGFCMAITNAVIPGARWSESLVPGVVSAMIIAGTGWALDTIFKPRRGGGIAPRTIVEGSWALLMPLFTLLVLLGASVGLLHALFGVRVVGIVMFVVPVIALVWAMLQQRSGGDVQMTGRLKNFLGIELPRSDGEITLLMMAGYIGTTGAPLLTPVVAAGGFSLGAFPAWAVLASCVWVIPLLGQFGMNPILAVTLVAPLVPASAEMGVTPASIVGALAAGWAISGISSPFTATTLLVGSFANVSAFHVGVRWNGVYVVIVTLLLIAWVLGYAFLLT